MPNEELHDELMKLFREYFELNQKWAVHQSHASGIRLRNCLSKIRRLCREQRIVIQEWRYENFAPMTQSKAAKEREKLKANQNQKGKEVDTDN